jgi:hypothetical protein
LGLYISIIHISLIKHACRSTDYWVDGRGGSKGGSPPPIKLEKIIESHKKIIKTLHTIVCFSVLSISSAFTILTYFINECMHLGGISRKQ